MGVALVRGWDEDTLFGVSVNDDEDRGELGGGRKVLDEVHGDGFPRS